MSWTKEQMAQKIIAHFAPGCSVNLGIGLPGIIAEHIRPQDNVTIHAENGVLGVSGRPDKDAVSPTLINAGKETIAISKGACFFDSATSFGMIRGGHIDYCVLGAMEVDVRRNLANWMIPGKKVTGMGGAMDLVHGAKNVIVMMNHFNKAGLAKLVRQCKLPLTGEDVVDLVFTDQGVFRPTGTTFAIVELACGVSESQLEGKKKGPPATTPLFSASCL